MTHGSVPDASPTVLDALRASPVGPVLDMPLPPTPALPSGAMPAPGPEAITELLQSIPIPTLPGVDELTRPIAELGAMFGTGVCEGIDPASILEQGARFLDGATSLGRAALDVLPDSWEGGAAELTADYTQRAQVAAVELSERGDLIGNVTRAASATVERGNIELTGIAQSFITSAVAAAPVALTPPGQAAIIASAAEHLGAALAVVARTRGELGVHTVAMNALTPPIPVPAPAVTAMPVEPGALTGAASRAVSGVGEMVTATGHGSTVPASAAAISPAGVHTAPASVAAGLGAAGGAGSYATVGAGSAAGVPGAAPLAAVAPTGSAAAPGGPGTGSTAAARGPVVGGAPVGTAARNDDTDRRGTPGFLVTAGSDSEVVGPLPLVTPAVIGGLDDGL